MSKYPDPYQETGLEIAVIGMAGRFPGAKNIDEFWNNLKNGRDSVSLFTGQELIEAGIEPELVNNPNYIKAKGLLEDIEYFDAYFFDYTDEEAELMDPQVRIVHECVWEALEDAGYDPGSDDDLIGLYTGAAVHNEWMAQLLRVGTAIQTQISSPGLFTNKEFLTTRVAYKLNLKGPAAAVFSACSTSLLTIHQACQGLLNGECTLAAAGGVSVTVPKKSGYIYQEGQIRSPEGRCRTFDAAAKGTVFGNGVGIVVLKLLDEALAQRDHIYALVKGSAVNNDGRRKVGYTAPSLKGQTAVIRAAYHAAEIDPATIDYIEAHGTGTIMGDPIEVQALTEAFNTTKKGFCALGSVKTNVGHLDTAAGAAGFIKTVLILKHKIIPPCIHYETPNPQIDFENTPFYVNTTLKKWKNNKPFRAGVSSFGIGGTNVHVILEEAPITQSAERKAQSAGREYQLILLSAKTETALEQMTANLAQYFKNNPGINLADAAYTLQKGRSSFAYRRALVCPGAQQAAAALSSPDPGQIYFLYSKNSPRTNVFMFPGQGSQYVDMGLELYQTEGVFRQEMNRCFEILKPLTDCDSKEILYPASQHDRSNRSNRSYKTYKSHINRTEIAQPMIFAFEYALSRQLMHWGIKPGAMIGHSVGEYTAACLAGVFSLEDALALTALRGKLMQQMPGGSMLSVPLPEEKLIPLLPLTGEIALAAVNSPRNSVVSGTYEAIEKLAGELNKQGYKTRTLHTSHAFHSPMMDPVLEPFRKKLEQVTLNEPKIPFIANVTGTWLTAEQSTSPQYWVSHLRKTVRFADGLNELLKKENVIFMEVGPGQVLSTLARQQQNRPTTAEKQDQWIVNLVRPPQDQVRDNHYLLSKIGQMWCFGQKPDWDGFYSSEKRYRISLPPYPFERRRYWKVMEAKPQTPPPLPTLTQKKGPGEWFYFPWWKRSQQPAPASLKVEAKTSWLVFTDSLGFGSRLVKRLEKKGMDVISVSRGSGFEKVRNGMYTLNPHSSKDYDALFADLQTLEWFPGIIIHLWNITDSNSTGSLLEGLDKTWAAGFYSLLATARAMGKPKFDHKVHMFVVTDNMQEVLGGDLIYPLKAVVLGPIRFLPQEFPHIRCHSIDMDFNSPGSLEQDRGLEQLLGEITSKTPHQVAAFRGRYRWELHFSPIRLEEPVKKNQRLCQFGVYLVTGGGSMGRVLAKQLAAEVNPRLLLTTPRPVPPRSQWDQWLSRHGKDHPVSQKINHVKELEQLGAEVMIIEADTANLEQMQAAIARLKERFGRIDGVIHCPGPWDGDNGEAALTGVPMPQGWEKIFSPKIKGTLVLDHVLRDEAPDFFILGSSDPPTHEPAAGMAYCTANAFLDAFAFYRTHRDGTLTTSITRDIQEQPMGSVNVNPPLTRLEKLTHPLFTGYMKVNETLVIFMTCLSVKKHWFLDEHRVVGSAIVLGTLYLEMARAAFENHVAPGPIEIRDFFLLNPLMVGDDEEVDLYLFLENHGNYFHFFFVSRSITGKDGWKPHARGEIAAVEERPRKKHQIAAIEAEAGMSTVTYSLKNQKPYENSVIEVGPRWDTLVEVKLGHHQGLALFQLPGKYSGDLESFQLHPALLDFAASYLNMMVRPFPGETYFPFSYKRLRMSRPLPPGIVCYSRYIENKNRGKATLTFDLLLMDEEGNELVDIKGFSMLAAGAAGDTTAHKIRDTYPIPSFVSLLNKQSPVSSPHDPGNQLETGILSTKLVEVFNGILESKIPQVLISNRDVSVLLEYDDLTRDGQRGREAQPAGSSVQKLMRHNFSTTYVPPGNKTEQALARVLSDYLGIDKVGRHDNFFELGVTSLDITQVLGQIEKAVKKKVSLVAMFSYPTIKTLAEHLAEETSKTRFLPDEVQRLEKRNIQQKNKLIQLKRNIEGEPNES